MNSMTTPRDEYCELCETTYSDADGHDNCPIQECDECYKKFNVEEDPCETGICLDCRAMDGNE